MKRIVIVGVMVAAYTLPAGLAAQDVSLDVREMLTASEFRAMGLAKLSDQELSRLNEWILSFAAEAFALGTESSGGATPAVIESKIDGEFECWEGDTVFQLMNGQIWQQTDFQYRYCYKFMPDVLIYQSGGVYRMKVDGVDGTVAVRRLR